MKKFSLLKSEKNFGRDANWITTPLSLSPMPNKKLN